jgi:enoyl-CoA hydratase/carnithine racemase
MAYELMRGEIDGPVGTLVFNRPEVLNSFHA